MIVNRGKTIHESTDMYCTGMSCGEKASLFICSSTPYDTVLKVEAFNATTN